MPTYREAIRQAIRLMEETPDDKVNMTRVSNACGTVRCLMGWMAGDRWFIANTAIAEMLTEDGCYRGVGKRSDEEILSEMLGIDERDVQRLFLLHSGSLDGHLIPKSEVIKHLNLALEGLPVPPYAAVIAAYGPDHP